MHIIEFGKILKEKYNDKNLKDEKIVKEINGDICNFLKNLKKGQILEKIYLGKLAGETNKEIAQEAGVSVNVVANAINKVRKVVEWIQYFGIDIEPFENLKCKSYTLSNKTSRSKR